MSHKMKLIMLEGSKAGADYPLDAEVMRLGREHARTIPLDDPLVSRRHAEITCAQEGENEDTCTRWQITDLGSLNGTLINGAQLDKSRLLADGDKIQIGSTVFGFESVGKDHRFQNLLAMLIALSALAGALMAWRINIISGDAGGYDGKGLTALLGFTNAETNTNAVICMDIEAYTDYHWRMRMAELIDRDLDQTNGEEQRAELRQEALANRKLASVSRRYFHTDYLKPADTPGAETYDRARYHAACMAGEASQADLDYSIHFKEADRERSHSLWLSFLTIILGCSVFFYTSARISITNWKYRFAALGAGLFLASVVSAVLLELLAH